jgi:aspartate kinase
MPSGIDTMSVIVNTESFKGKERSTIDEIKFRVSPDLVRIEENLALVAVVGRGMRKTKGVAGKVFTALADAGVNVRMIDQGSSELNIVVGVDESDFETAVSSVYNAFF